MLFWVLTVGEIIMAHLWSPL